jgi:hypothetical protein
MLVIVELLIHIFLKVQANDLASISFHRSSSLNLLAHFSKLDKVQTNVFTPFTFSPSPLPILYPYSSELDKVLGIMHTRFENDIKVCEKDYPKHRSSNSQWHLFKYCVIGKFTSCLKKHTHPWSEFTVQHFNCVVNCIKHRSDLGACLTECFEKHVNK